MKTLTVDYGYRTRDFNDLFPTVEKFKEAYGACEIPMELTAEEQSLLYYLLYARYGNSVFKSDDDNRITYQLFSIVWQYAPAWLKKLEIQKRLRELTEDDLLKGSKSIRNHAFHPGTEPSTSSLEELEYIDSQNTTAYKRSILEGYSNLIVLLENDVSEEFLNKFKKLFNQIGIPGKPLVYITEED